MIKYKTKVLMIWEWVGFATVGYGMVVLLALLHTVFLGQASQWGWVLKWGMIVLGAWIGLMGVLHARSLQQKRLFRLALRDIERWMEVGQKVTLEAKGNVSRQVEAHTAEVELACLSMEKAMQISRQNVQEAEDAINFTRTEHSQAIEVGEMMEELTATMGEVEQAVAQISEAISFIDDIAFKHNILALNAAVEAARAGEQSKGFSVVAEEVRHLAGQTTKSAQSVKDRIAVVRDHVEKGVGKAKQVHARIGEVSGRNRRVERILGRIAEDAAETAQLARKMYQSAAATKEMGAETARAMERYTDKIFESLYGGQRVVLDQMGVMDVSFASLQGKPPVPFGSPSHQGAASHYGQKQQGQQEQQEQQEHDQTRETGTPVNGASPLERPSPFPPPGENGEKWSSPDPRHEASPAVWHAVLHDGQKDPTSGPLHFASTPHPLKRV